MSEAENIVKSVITCPSCQAQYHVAPETLGKDGRRVKCAQCHNDWKAVVEPEPDQQDENVDALQEDVLDAAFETAEQKETPDNAEKVSKKSKKTAPKKMSAQEKKDVARRQSLLNRTMPKAKSHKVVRIVGGVLLFILVFGGVFLRENIVRTFPDMAGVYANIGLGVNVVGLEFVEVKTLRLLRDGNEVMDIAAGIKSVSSRQVSVPKILVTLLDEAGMSVYEWSVTSRAAIMLPGEWIEFETKLTSPPKEAVSVRLEFEQAK